MNKTLMTLVLASCLTATHRSHTAAEEQVFPVVPYVNAVEEFASKQHTNIKFLIDFISVDFVDNDLDGASTASPHIITSESTKYAINEQLPLRPRFEWPEDSTYSISSLSSEPAPCKLATAAPIIHTKDASLEAQLLEALQACTYHYTDKSKLTKTVKNLLEQQANPNIADNYGNSALHLAVRPYYTSKILPDGLEIPHQKETSFCLENIQNLILAGAHPDNQNDTGITAEQYLKIMLRESAHDRCICVTKTGYALETLQKAIAEKKARDAKAQLTHAAE